MFDKYHFKLTLKRPMLGTNPINSHILDTHIINKQRELILEKSGIERDLNKYLGAPDISKERSEEEIDALFEGLEKKLDKKISLEDRKEIIAGKIEKLKETLVEKELQGTTIFLRHEEKPCIGDHMIYGFMKAAGTAICDVSKRAKGVVLQSNTYTTRIVNTHVRCAQRFIVFDREADAEFCQRSLRAKTAQGDRIAIAKSEVMPVGSTLEFDLKVLKNSPLKSEHIKRMFEYGSEFSGLGQWRNAGNGMFDFEMTHESAMPKQSEVE